MAEMDDLLVKEKTLKKFENTVTGITFVGSDTKKLVKAAANGDIKSYCRFLQQYKFKSSRDYSIVLLIFSPIIVTAGALYKHMKDHKDLSFDEFHKKIYNLEHEILHERKSDFYKLCDYIGEGNGDEIAKILKRSRFKSYREMLKLLSENKYGHNEDAFMERVERISPWKIVNKKYMNNKLIPFVKDTLGSEFSAKIKQGLSAVQTGQTDSSVGHPDIKVLSDETKERIKHVSESLTRKRNLLLNNQKSDKTACKNTYEKLKTLLESDNEGAADISDLLDSEYCEWRDRLTKRHYATITGNRYENYALMNLAYSLRLAKAENYDAANPKNNELMIGNAEINETMLETIDDDTDEHKKTISQRLGKVIVEDEDILRSAQRHFDELGLANKTFGFLNAGDPYDPNGFLPNCGSALEEYLSMNTTLCRDLSHKKFRRSGGTATDAFYTEREKAFPPIVEFVDKDKKKRMIPADLKKKTKGAWERLTGKGRDFYHSRGLMSKKVYLTRKLGDLNQYYDQSGWRPEDRDPTSPWQHPGDKCDDFEVDRSSGLGSRSFYILSIAGLEDRSETLLTKGGDRHTAEEYQQKWKEITMKQCEFVLRAFIKSQVQVLFLCAFGAGCFGGKASIVADCFRELLIKRGYINYFDKVVFPIGYNMGNLNAFKTAFRAPK